MRLLSKLRAARRFESDMEAELRDHLERYAADLEAAGVDPREARRRARVAFGGMARVKEDCRSARGLGWLADIRNDARFALRLMRKQPGFTALAVATLGVGIGLNTTVFSVYNTVALRPLPVPDAGSVVRLRAIAPDGFRSDGFPYADYELLRVHTRTLAALAAATGPIGLAARTGAGGEAAAVEARLVSGNYFAMLRVAPSLGRIFLPEECRDPARANVVVLSHRFWSRQLASDPDVLGRSLLLNGTAVTVIGVMPEAFPGTGDPPQVPALWAPLPLFAQFAPAQSLRVRLIGRRGAPLRQVRSELSVLAPRLTGEEMRHARLLVLPATFFDRTGGEFDLFRWVIAALLVAVGTVLLIGCVNLVNLLLARAAARQQEIAMRFALGGSRGRLVRQLCCESAVLGLVGGAAGLVFSLFACRWLYAVLEQRLLAFGLGAEFLFLDLRPDWRVFAYTLVVSLGAGILVGLLPARQATRRDVNALLKLATSAALGGRRRLREALIAAQVAACLTLLAGAGLFSQGVLRLRQVSPGFETRRVFLLTSLAGAPPERRAGLVARTMEALARLPQVHAAAFVQQAPLMGHTSGPVEPLGSRVAYGTPDSIALSNVVSPSYFDTLGIPILRGRNFTERERASDASLVVISENAARRYWPGEDPLGKQIRTHGMFPPRLAKRTFTVIGVARNVRATNLSKLDAAYLYFPAQPGDAYGILLRSDAPAAELTPLLRAALKGVDPDYAARFLLLNLETGPVQLQRLMTEAPAVAAGVLAALALLLSGVGIYGVVAFTVSRRTREIGIRLALGATRGQVLALVARQSLGPVLWGAPIGLAGSAALSVLIGSLVASPETPDLLFGASPWSGAVLAAAIALPAVTVLLAGWVPARRATRVDPVAALRDE